MTDNNIQSLAEAAVKQMAAADLTLATAESCTGGLVSAAITDVAGASQVFTHGFVTYANEAKRDLLGVGEDDLAAFGAVSPQVAEQMAKGAAMAAKADRAVSITGIAGPGGGTAEKPVGLVYLGVWDGRTASHQRCLFDLKGRAQIRSASVSAALSLLIENI